MKNIFKRFWKKSKKYIKVIGINGIGALIIWLSPTWLALFIPALKPFAIKWLALVVSPIVPSWAAVPILAVLVALLRKGIVILIRWTKDQVKKLKCGAEIFTLFDGDEIEIILLKGRKMKNLKDDATNKFKNELKNERQKLIKENWETELEE